MVTNWRRFLTLVYWQTQLAAILSRGQTVNVVATFDGWEPEHVTDGGECWCTPRVEHYPGGDVTIHHDLDELMGVEVQ